MNTILVSIFFILFATDLKAPNVIMAGLIQFHCSIFLYFVYFLSDEVILFSDFRLRFLLIADVVRVIFFFMSNLVFYKVKFEYQNEAKIEKREDKNKGFPPL